MSIKTYRHSIDNDKINSIHAIVVKLAALDKYLEGTELDTVKFFNRVYVFVDKELEDAVSSGTFLYPDLVKKLDIAFSLYYFEALNHFVENKTLPRMWSDITTKGVVTPFYFLLGANVHINHDLPLAILDSIPNLEEFKSDFYKIDEVIEKAIKKFFQVYKPTGNFAFIKHFFFSLFRKPVILVIIRWRHKAWRAAQLVSMQRLQQVDLVSKTERISKKLIFYGKLL